MATVAVCILLVLVTGLVMRQMWLGDVQVRSESGVSESSDGGGEASPQPESPARESQAPQHVVDATGVGSLTLPEYVYMAKESFSVEAGRSYLLSFELDTVKPEGEPGRIMYLGVTLSCTGAASGSVGGTENLIPEEPVTYANQMLLTPSEDGVVTCQVLASSPIEEVAARGTTIELEAEWSAVRLGGYAVETPAGEELPMTVPAGERSSAFSQVVPLHSVPSRRLDVLSTLHVTTCTGTGGSRENGKVWCARKDLDGDGSEFDLELTVDVINADGSVCESLRRVVSSQHVDVDQHHALFQLYDSAIVPESACGSALRVSVVVINSGPASLVVHESNSSLIAAEM
ncbi:hypothetical protein [Brachybacterium sp. YJGR34]|uniref:hypothetical protein n=1 Tax=Brachybacterium sp. YJGR34 TaxID=2059911 RepID=UPI001E5CE81E|nr:hypothetical protein [Brachybacterium sp. YJGR34]